MGSTKPSLNLLIDTGHISHNQRARPELAIDPFTVPLKSEFISRQSKNAVKNVSHL